MIPVYQPLLNGNEKKYVDECMDTSWISSKGRFVTDFENKVAEFLGVKHATATCNGTVPIHLALLALGLQPGDEVLVPSFTYIASVNPIVLVGAKPVFVDCLADTMQIDPDDIERKITDKTRAIVVVHLYGHPADMDKICAIAKKHNLYIIEDCAEAFGSKYKGKYCGTFGDVATFSFFGNKTITCGEGGMAVANNDEVFAKLYKLKTQGVSSVKEYWHDIIGFNYRMTNIAAAIGLAQLEQINEIFAKKRQIADWYYEELKDLIGDKLYMLRENGDVISSYWMVTLFCNSEKDRNELRAFMKNAGIETRPTFYPVHTMPPYEHLKSDNLSVTMDVALRGMNVPSYPALTHEDVKFICDKIKEYYAK